MATWWVEFLEKLGPNFPTPDAPEDTWRHFVVSCSYWPFVLLSFGVLVALGVLCCTCTCQSRTRTLAQRPSVKWLALIMLLTLGIIVVGTTVYWQTGTMAWHNAISQLDQVVSECTIARDEGGELRSVDVWLLQDLDAIPEACQEKTQGRVNELKEKILHFSALVDKYYFDTEPLPKKLHAIQNLSNGIRAITQIGLLTPMVLVLICCLTVLSAAVCSQRGCFSLLCVRCLGPVVFAPTIIIAAVAGAVELEVGIVMSSFCTDVDSNVLAYIEHSVGANSSLYAASQYYITKMGDNPFLDELNGASVALHSARTMADHYGDAIARACPDWHKAANLTASLNKAEEGIAIGQRLLSLDNIYKYYAQVVRQDACQTAVVGLGWLVLFQASAGLICLPWLILATIRYLKARRWWHFEGIARAHLIPGAIGSAEMRGGV